jgi:hypothetical protein
LDIFLRSIYKNLSFGRIIFIYIIALFEKDILSVISSCRSQRKDGGRKPKNNLEFFISLKWGLKRFARDHYRIYFSTTETT